MLETTLFLFFLHSFVPPEAPGKSTSCTWQIIRLDWHQWVGRFEVSNVPPDQLLARAKEMLMKIYNICWEGSESNVDSEESFDNTRGICWTNVPLASNVTEKRWGGWPVGAEPDQWRWSAGAHPNNEGAQTQAPFGQNTEARSSWKFRSIKLAGWKTYCNNNM